VLIACVQLNSRDDKAANVAAAAAFVRQAAGEGARLVVLPETWNYKGSARGIAENAEPLDGPSTTAMRELAAGLGIYLLAGSFYEITGTPGRSYNTSVLFGPGGEQLAVYRKIHLFDATAGVTVHRESESLEPGASLVTTEVDGVTVGLSICYDLRFPELYISLALRGARVLLVPSAFTEYTGSSHWELLVRARALDTGCFVVAPDQVGFHLPDRASFGHSMVVDPWGRLLTELPEGTGMCLARVDPEEVSRVRAALPVLQHRRPDAYDLG
jgi:deaminated glutathione amidase